MRVAVVFDTPYSGRNHRPRGAVVFRVPLIVKPPQADASAGIRPASVVEGGGVLEANANLFINYGHDMANAAAKAGMEYCDFIQRIVDAAVARYERA
jgi:hypothetical protein